VDETHEDGQGAEQAADKIADERLEKGARVVHFRDDRHTGPISVCAAVALARVDHELAVVGRAFAFDAKAADDERALAGRVELVERVGEQVRCRRQRRRARRMEVD
jgi:hypothetical protein